MPNTTALHLFINSELAVSDSVLADLSVRSPHIIFIFIIKNNMYQIKVSYIITGSGGMEALSPQWLSVLLFSKLNKIFFGYFDTENIFLDDKIK